MAPCRVPRCYIEQLCKDCTPFCPRHSYVRRIRCKCGDPLEVPAVPTPCVSPEIQIKELKSKNNTLSKEQASALRKAALAESQLSMTKLAADKAKRELEMTNQMLLDMEAQLKAAKAAAGEQKREHEEIIKERWQLSTLAEFNSYFADKGGFITFNPDLNFTLMEDICNKARAEAGLLLTPEECVSGWSKSLVAQYEEVYKSIPRYTDDEMLAMSVEEIPNGNA